jgi:hypothetical protein
MRVHSQTMDRRMQVSVPVRVGGLAWWQRFCQWFKPLTHSPRQIAPVSPYGTWDAQREHYEPMRAEAALDIVASRNGALWSTKIYNSTI